MKKTANSKRGAIIVFVLIINAIMIFAFTVLLSSVVMDFKMKKLNSKIKKEFYYAEAGLDEAYAMTLEYLSAVLDYFYENRIENKYGDEYIYNEFKNVIKGSSNCFYDKDSLAEILTDKDNYLISNEYYPMIDVELKEEQEYFLLKINSYYKTGEVLNSLSLSCKISVPGNGNELKNITAENLITDNYWNIGR